MDMLPALCILVFAVAIAAVVWFGLRAARRENERLNAEAVDAFISPVDQTRSGGGGGPRPTK